MNLELVLRFDYGSVVPWVHRIERGIHAIAGPDMVRLLTDVPLHGENMKTAAEFTVAEGQKISFNLTWFPSNVRETAPLNIDTAIEKTERWWSEWSGRCSYQGPWRDAVVRSLITLKGLTFLPTGGIVAAPTTSLPEQLGGVRNWDYRFCWVRDATLTLLALLNAGYLEEAREWREWLMRAVAGSPEELNIVYGLRGERRIDGTGTAVAAGVRKIGSGANRQCGLQAISIGHFWRGCQHAFSGAPGGTGSSAAPARAKWLWRWWNFWRRDGSGPMMASGRCAVRGGISSTPR